MPFNRGGFGGKKGGESKAKRKKKKQNAKKRTRNLFFTPIRGFLLDNEKQALKQRNKKERESLLGGKKGGKNERLKFLAA